MVEVKWQRPRSRCVLRLDRRSTVWTQARGYSHVALEERIMARGENGKTSWDVRNWHNGTCDVTFLVIPPFPGIMLDPRTGNAPPGHVAYGQIAKYARDMAKVKSAKCRSNFYVAPTGNDPVRQRAVCRHFQGKGYCERGDRCHFLHVRGER